MLDPKLNNLFQSTQLGVLNSINKTGGDEILGTVLVLAISILCDFIYMYVWFSVLCFVLFLVSEVAVAVDKSSLKREN
jgi:hypothetical protein